MTPHDQQRLAKLVSEFVEGCGFDPPLYVIAIGANGFVAVSRHSDFGVEHCCSRIMEAGLVAPIVVTVVTEDGRGKSARIEIVVRGMMQ
jgi:hypothetical protein